MSKATAYRLSDATLEQIDTLAKRYNGNKTTVVAVAVDRLTRQGGGVTRVELLRNMGYEVATNDEGKEFTMDELVSTFDQMRPGEYWLSVDDYGIRVVYEVMDGIPTYWLVQTRRQQQLQREAREREQAQARKMASRPFDPVHFLDDDAE